MNKGRLTICTIALCAACMLLGAGALHAESVFLKDGSIVEGKIIKETDAEIQVVLKNKEQRLLPRRDVLRTVYHDEYKEKRYIYLLNGDMVEGFIVDEDREAYTYRTDINSIKENRVVKNKVDFISKRQLEIKEKKEATKKAVTPKQADAGQPGPKNRKEELTTRAARIRLGGGVTVFQPYMNYDKWGPEGGHGGTFIADACILRMRNTEGNGFDIIARGKLSEGWKGTGGPTAAQILQELRDFTGENLPAWDNFEKFNMTQFAFGLGIRYVHGIYLLGILWQGYGMAYAQYSYIPWYAQGRFLAGDLQTYKGVEHSSGVVGGVGLEAGLFKYFGVFIEMTYGYSPVFSTSGSKNIETPMLLFGVSWRTSFI